MANKVGHRVVYVGPEAAYGAIVFTARNIDIFTIGADERELLDALVGAMDKYESKKKQLTDESK